MKTRIVICIALYFMFIEVLAVCAQSKSTDKSIEQVIERMFHGFRTNDSSIVASTFYDRSPYLATSGSRNNGSYFRENENFEQLLSAIARPKSESEIWDEQIYDLNIMRDGALAMVYCPYKFYVGKAFSHCGVNFFTLVETEQGWKIVSIVDTRRNNACK